MGILAEDITLPVEPKVSMYARKVPQELQAHFGVLGEVSLWIEERLNEPMVLPAIDIAQHDGKATEVSLSPEPGKQMSASGVLVAFPERNVVIDVVRVSVSTVEDKRLQAQLKLYLSQRHVGELGLNPKSRQGITVRQAARELIISEEADTLQLHLERMQVRRIKAIRGRGKLLPHLSISQLKIEN